MEEKNTELQEQLKGIRAAQKMEDDLEIVKSIRSMKLNGRDLFKLLCSLQNGNVTIQGNFHFEAPQKKGRRRNRQFLKKREGAEKPTTEQMQESEDKGYEKKMEETY